MYRLASILYIVLALLVSPSAYSSGVYTIAGVGVSSVGDSATDARNLATLKGEREAFSRLSERLTSGFSRYSLPELDDNEISNMILGVEVKQEKTTEKYYEAVLDISFNPVLIQKLFQEFSVTIVDKRPPKAIILPIFYNKGEAILWQGTENIWYASWAKALANYSGLLDLVMPLGDVSDISSLSAGQVLSFGKSSDAEIAIRGIIDKYDAGQAIIATASYSLGDVVSKLTSTGRGEYLGEFAYSLDREKSDADNLQDFITEILENLEESWKRQAIAKVKQQINIKVHVALDSISQWQNINRKLKQVRSIKRLSLLELTSKSAVFDMSFADGNIDIQNILLQNGFALESKGNKIFLKEQL